MKINQGDFIFSTKDSKGNVVMTKSEIIELVHRKKYGYLPKSKILFLDDLIEELNPVRVKGYPAIQAKSNGEHFEKAIDFIENLSVSSDLSVEHKETESEGIAFSLC